MPISDTMVKQDSYEALKDGTGGLLRLNRRGEVISPDSIIQMILDGRVFTSSNATMETINKLGDASYAEAVAGLALDVPNGVTVIPLEIMMTQAGTVAGGDVTVLMTVDTKLRITSGVASTPRNLLINATEAYPSMCTLKSHEEGSTNLVVSAPAGDYSFYSKMMAENIIGGFDQQAIWSTREYPPPIIRGPGALVVYTYTAASAAPEYFWHMIWAEIPTANA